MSPTLLSAAVVIGTLRAKTNGVFHKEGLQIMNSKKILYFFFLRNIDFVLSNSTDPDEMLHYVSFHLGLLVFQRTCQGISCLQRVKHQK